MKILFVITLIFKYLLITYFVGFAIYKFESIFDPFSQGINDEDRSLFFLYGAVWPVSLPFYMLVVIIYILIHVVKKIKEY